jgi:PAS domain S-box-containing protein
MTVITAAGALAVLWAAATLAVTRNLPPSAYLLAALTLVTGFGKFSMPGAPASFSVSEIFTMTAAVLFGPAAATLLVAADAVAMSLRLRPDQRTAARIIYNATASALAILIATQIFAAAGSAARLLPGRFAGVGLPLIVFAMVYFVLNTGFVAVAVARERREPLPRVWWTHFAKLWFTFVAGASVAGFVRLVATSSEPGLRTIVLVVPLVALVYMAAHGVVERVRERREHVAERELYATALRSTADAVMLTSPDRRVTYMNLAAERLTGCTSSEARGRLDVDVFRIAVPATRRRETEPDAGAPAALVEFVLTRPDGSESPIEAMHAPIVADDGEFRGLVWTFRDVRDRKAAEGQRELLLARERDAHAAAVTASRIKDEFLAVVSHELRTPATSILGWARLLRDDRMDPSAAQKALAALERAARAQATMLDDLVDASRMVQGTLRLDVRPTDIMTPLREALETMAPAFRAKALQVNLAATTALDPIDADPDRLRQVFCNLLGNAGKFTATGGRIDIAVRRDGNDLSIEFADDGQGIEPAFLPYVFDRFKQGDSSATRRHGGLGLGLSIVRYLVESHGGTVAAVSDGVGRGARFTVRLPAPIRRRTDDHVHLAS